MGIWLTLKIEEHMYETFDKQRNIFKAKVSKIHISKVLCLDTFPINGKHILHVDC